MKTTEEDERREAALAEASDILSNTKNRNITEDQLNKLKELRKRRLQIKATSKVQRYPKESAAGTAKAQEEVSGQDETDEKASVDLTDSSVSPAKQNEVLSSSSLKKRRKLHWGLDTKQRWERKANM